MKLQIQRTSKNGYWVTIGGYTSFNTNIRYTLEDASDNLAERVADLQKQILELQNQKAEVDKELEKQGGKLRPRRRAVPKTDWPFSDCSSCKASNHNLNMVAFEVDIGVVKVFCSKCGHRKFPSLIR